MPGRPRISALALGVALGSCWLAASVARADTTQAAAAKARVATLGFAAGGALLATGSLLWLIGSVADTDGTSSPSTAPLASAGALGWSIAGSF
jgi:hypothetical protein